MAVDTAKKRFSMMRFVCPTALSLSIVPSGSIDAADRATLLGLYGGIALAGITLLPSYFSMIVRNRRRAEDL